MNLLDSSNYLSYNVTGVIYRRAMNADYPGIISYQSTSVKPLAQVDFFHILKLDHLTEDDKHKRLDALWRVALLHFINVDLPHLLTPDDYRQLETMTESQTDINLAAVESFLRQKVKNYDELITRNTCAIKKQLIKHHYEQELKMRELEQQHKGFNRLEKILSIQRLLQAVDLDDWDSVESIVPLTRVEEESH